MKNVTDNIIWEDLREQIMCTKSAGLEKPLSKEIMNLLNELEVYRAELELENQRNTLAKDQAERESKEYIELFDYAPVGHITLSSEGKINRINLTAALLLGKDRRILIGESFDHYLSADSKEILKNFLNRIIENKAKETWELTLLSKGKMKEFEVTGVITDISNQCLITLIDISGHKKAQNHLIKSKEKAEKADRMKTSFLSTMSHEFRTPLNSIIGFSGILLQEFAGKLNAEQKKQLGMILSGGRHLLSMINDLLDLSRIEAGQLKANPEYFALKDVIEDVVKLEWPFAMSKGISIDFEISPEISTVKSDKQRLHQVLLNLINNAIKFTEKGSVKVNCNKENDFVKIEVIDTGIGIEKENLDKIFDPFIQVENELTRSQRGSGLGLSVSRKLIELLQGTINVKSEIGAGTTFTVTLPIL